MLLGQSSQIIKNITEYICYFVARSIHHNPENQPWSTVRAPEGLRDKRSTLPLAVHVLLLLIKNVLAAFVERIRMQCSCLFLSMLFGKDGT